MSGWFVSLIKYIDKAKSLSPSREYTVSFVLKTSEGYGRDNGIDRDVVTVDNQGIPWCRIQPSRGNAGSTPATSTIQYKYDNSRIIYIQTIKLNNNE